MKESTAVNDDAPIRQVNNVASGKNLLRGIAASNAAACGAAHAACDSVFRDGFDRVGY